MDNKEFCGTCGQQMNKTVIKTLGFNTKTGEEEYLIRFRCPNWKWYKFNHYDSLYAPTWYIFDY